MLDQSRPELLLWVSPSGPDYKHSLSDSNREIWLMSWTILPHSLTQDDDWVFIVFSSSRRMWSELLENCTALIIHNVAEIVQLTMNLHFPESDGQTHSTPPCCCSSDNYYVIVFFNNTHLFADWILRIEKEQKKIINFPKSAFAAHWRWKENLSFFCCALWCWSCQIMCKFNFFVLQL